MGGILQTPIYQSRNLREEIVGARRKWNVAFYATVLDETALVLDESAESEFARHENVAFVFGNEYSGLDASYISLCDAKMTIPMRRDVDSLNLGVSVGVFLYEFNRRQRKM